MRWFRKQQNRQSSGAANQKQTEEPFFWVMVCLLLYLDLITQKKNGGDL